MHTGLKLIFSHFVILLCFIDASAQDTLRVSNTFKFEQQHNNFTNITPISLPKNFATQNYSFFCKQELQLARKNIPFSFRLGSMDHCNFLEQKPGYKLAPTAR